ncbi:MAG: rhomboid family intramembrane serine protease [Bacteroidota bacterium]
MIFPVGDEQIEGGAKPIFSYSFIAVNILVYLFQVSVPGGLICEFGVIPNDILNGEGYVTLLTSMFMHGGWMHLIGNMLFLWVFADNIEATVGNFNFVIFYLLGGLAASAIHIYFNTGFDIVNCCEPCQVSGLRCGQGDRPCPGMIPSIGASGALSAVMGAYMVMFPRSKVKVLVVYLFSTFRMAAIWFLGLWIGQQLIAGFAALGPETAATDGVAWWAHIGGFGFGVLAGLVARKGGMGHPWRKNGPDGKVSIRDYV